MKTPFRIPALLAILAACSLATAADIHWDGVDTSANADGGTGTWNFTNTNWDDAATAGNSVAYINGTAASPGDNVIFGGSAGTVTMGVSNIYAGSLTFTSAGYTLQIGANRNGYFAGVVTLPTSGTTTIQSTGNSSTLHFDGGINLNGGNLICSKRNDGPPGPYTFGVISGNGSIELKQGAATANYLFDAANDYSGTTTLTGGFLKVNHATALGTSTLVFNGGGIDNSSSAAITLSNNNSQSWNANFTFIGTKNLDLGTGAVTLGGSPTVTVSANTLTVGGVIGDGGNTRGLTKAGPGTLLLTNANTYTGETSVTAGTLSLGNATDNTSLGDVSTVNLTSGAYLDLNFAGTDVIGKLFIDGIQQTTGTWGSSTSGAEHPNNEVFTGSGTLTVTIVPDPLMVVANTVTAAAFNTPTPMSIPVSNNGATVTLDITAIAIGGDDAASFGIDSAMPIHIAPGIPGSIDYTFTPTHGPGSYTATFEVTSNDLTQSPTTITLNISVSDPIIAVSTSTLDFGMLGNAPGPQVMTVTVANDGGVENLVIADTPRSGAPEFSVTSAPASIAPGESADVEVTFTPGTAGGRFSGVLQILSNDSQGVTPTIRLEAFVNPAGVVVARFDFDPSQIVGATVDSDDSAQSAWTTGNLVDLATGLGAGDSSNQGTNNRAMRTGFSDNFLAFSLNRESDAQTPLAGGGDNETTWTSFTVSPEADGTALNFTGGTAVVDTYADSNLGGAAANWTLYYSTDGGSSWTSLGTLTGQSTPDGIEGPLGLNWDLSPIGNRTTPVAFVLDPVATGALNGTVNQRSVGFDNLLVTAGSVTPGGSPSANFSTWASGLSIPDDPAYDAGDHDGIPALVEYALGLSPLLTESLANAFDPATRVVSFTKGTEAVFNNDITYSIETSPDLLDPWTPVSYVLPDVDNSTTISYTLPASQTRIFARLVVTQVP